MRTVDVVVWSQEDNQLAELRRWSNRRENVLPRVVTNALDRFRIPACLLVHQPTHTGDDMKTKNKNSAKEVCLRTKRTEKKNTQMGI